MTMKKLNQTGYLCIETEKMTRVTINGEEKEITLKYIFSVPLGAPLGLTYDACFEMLGEILKLSQEATAKAARSEEISESQN